MWKRVTTESRTLINLYLRECALLNELRTRQFYNIAPDSCLNEGQPGRFGLCKAAVGFSGFVRLRHLRRGFPLKSQPLPTRGAVLDAQGADRLVHSTRFQMCKTFIQAITFWDNVDVRTQAASHIFSSSGLLKGTGSRLPILRSVSTSTPRTYRTR